MTYDPSVTDTVADYVRAVESHLAGVSADEREEILRNVEAHIYDALESRAGEAATADDLQAVLAEMDPPASYADGHPLPPAPMAVADDRRSLAGWALGLMIGGVVLPLLVIAIAMIVGDGHTSDSVVAVAVILGIALEMFALVLGLLSWRERVGKAVVWIVAVVFGLGLIFLGLVLFLFTPRRSDAMEQEQLDAMIAVDAAARRDEHMAETQRKAAAAIRQFIESQPSETPIEDAEDGWVLEAVRTIPKGMRAFTLRVDSQVSNPLFLRDSHVDIYGVFTLPGRERDTYRIVTGLRLIKKSEAEDWPGPGTDIFTVMVTAGTADSLAKILSHAEGAVRFMVTSADDLPDAGTIHPDLLPLATRPAGGGAD